MDVAIALLGAVACAALAIVAQSPVAIGFCGFFSGWCAALGFVSITINRNRA